MNAKFITIDELMMERYINKKISPLNRPLYGFVEWYITLYLNGKVVMNRKGNTVEKRILVNDIEVLKFDCNYEILKGNGCRKVLFDFELN